MHGKIMRKKLAAATIIETIVALLIVMISFSAGMVIYNRVLSAGVNDQEMSAGLQTAFLTDSLVQTKDIRYQQITSADRHFTISYAPAKYTGLLVMKVTCTDDNGKQLAAQIRLIREHEKK